MRCIFKAQPKQRSIRWSVFLIVVFLIFSFAIVGHSLFLARGNHICDLADCAVCDVLSGVMHVAGSSAVVAVAAYAVMSSKYINTCFESRIDLSDQFYITLVNAKIRMNN
jgi:ribose/xylose/arabinose/galactoside ABC-type transport system permease subunit